MTTATKPQEKVRAPRLPAENTTIRDRPIGHLLWYRFVQMIVATLFAAFGGWRATGRDHIPESGGVLLVSNHLSFLDVFVLGVPLRRPLNYVARSTLFIPILGPIMRSVGGFPIQRDGMGASGLKETLRRLKNGGIVTLFPEGTRSRDGSFGEIKPGIAVLVTRARVPVVPVGLAGTFEGWPRWQRLPRPHAIRIHYGPPIYPDDLAGMETDSIQALIGERMRQCVEEARAQLRRDLDRLV